MRRVAHGGAWPAAAAGVQLVQIHAACLPRKGQSPARWCRPKPRASAPAPPHPPHPPAGSPGHPPPRAAGPPAPAPAASAAKGRAAGQRQRFGQMIVHAGGQALGHVCRLRVGRHRHNRHPLARCAFPACESLPWPRSRPSPACCNPSESHPRPLLKRQHRHAAIGHHLRLATQQLQHAGGNGLAGAVVLHHQNTPTPARRPVASHLPRRAPPASVPGTPAGAPGARVWPGRHRPAAHRARTPRHSGSSAPCGGGQTGAHVRKSCTSAACACASNMSTINSW
jgi:hypothetical protein